MSIRPLHARLTINDAAFEHACDLIDRSKAAHSLQAWMDEEAQDAATFSATRTPRPTYPPRALLIGLTLLIHTGQDVSWTSLLRLYWCQLTDQHLASLGLLGAMDPERLREFRTLARGKAVRWPEPTMRRLRSEYTRLIRSLDATFNTVRYSPHDRKNKKTNAAIKNTAATLTDQTLAILAAKAERHAALLNDLVAASVRPELLQRHKGDIMFDEVVIHVANRGDTGTKDHKRHSGNPDAGWWQKGKKDTPRWAHGATFIMTSQRTTETPMPTLVVGMAIGKATGGSVNDTLTALDQAVRTGMLKDRQNKGRSSRLAIADMGFTLKDGMNHALVDRGYNVLQDFQKNRTLRTPLAEGPYVFNSVILCPGFAKETKTPFPRLDKTAPSQAHLRHEQRESLLLAGRMPTNSRPKTAKQAKRGRPRKDAESCTDMRLEVVCPAAALQCRCPHVAQSLSLPPQTPSVPNPPASYDLPEVCKKAYSSVLLDKKAFKQYGVHLYGGSEFERLYSHARALNEQWHSLLRASHTGRIEGNFFKTLGIERIGVILALAVAETNEAMQRSFLQRKEPSNLAA